MLFKDWSLHVTTYQDNKSLSITSLIIEITSPIFDTKVNPRALKFYCQPSKENPVLPNFVISRDYNLLVIFMTGNLLFHTYQDLHMEKEPAHVVHNQPIRKANDGENASFVQSVTRTILFFKMEGNKRSPFRKNKRKEEVPSFAFLEGIIDYVILAVFIIKFALAIKRLPIFEMCWSERKNLSMREMKTFYHVKCARTIFIHSLPCIKKLFFYAPRLVNKNRSCVLSME